ncbi:class I SAM-dependent methyltransferase [Salinivibrio proteolyticus]|uniref:Class I SAM-dependent methyltransferase n=1 Tax=Salinivibrio proteolyticus TaxID=334715 RepID=A0ABY7LES0_9GAMM|nr:class I SAM-dependent methyltransferase [Salinivibrio proteolyticus]WBA13965.1 class I SAM-dependent methyltransferase [Salinivibrio proteolyticus]
MKDISDISNILELGENGIYFSETCETVSFPDDGHQIYARIEDRSFWFKHRNDCIISAVSNFRPPNDGVIFDVGGGNGFVSMGLKSKGFKVALLEPGIQGALVAKQRDIDTVICATVESAKIHSESLPAVGLFDVLEHIKYDKEFLFLLQDLLKKNGRLYITVPAWKSLWSHEDIIAGHYRRYSLRSIEELIKKVGFEIEYSSYFFRPLPLPIFLLRTLPFNFGLKSVSSVSSPKKDHQLSSGVSTYIINKLLSSEVTSIRNKEKMRFGASCLIVAKKL